MQLFLPELEYQPLNQIAPWLVMPLECPEKPGLQNRALCEKEKTKYLQVVWIIGLGLKPERKSIIAVHMRRLSIKSNW